MIIVSSVILYENIIPGTIIYFQNSETDISIPSNQRLPAIADTCHGEAELYILSTSLWRQDKLAAP